MLHWNSSTYCVVIKCKALFWYVNLERMNKTRAYNVCIASGSHAQPGVKTTKPAVIKEELPISIFPPYLVKLEFSHIPLCFEPNICGTGVCNNTGINSGKSVTRYLCASLHGHNDQDHFTRFSLWYEDCPVNSSFVNDKIKSSTPVNLTGCSCGSCSFCYLGTKEVLIILNAVAMAYSDWAERRDADGQQTVNLITALKPEVVWQVLTDIMILLFAVKLDSPPLWKQAVSSCHLLQRNKW